MFHQPFLNAGWQIMMTLQAITVREINKQKIERVVHAPSSNPTLYLHSILSTMSYKQGCQTHTSKQYCNTPRLLQSDCKNQ